MLAAVSDYPKIQESVVDSDAASAEAKYGYARRKSRRPSKDRPSSSQDVNKVALDAQIYS
jgi:hypothetical protein